MVKDEIKRKYYSLTHPQKRIWYVEKATGGSELNNIGGEFKVKGSINVHLMEKVLNTLVKNNEGLRIQILEKNGEPIQYVEPYKWEDVIYNDFSQRSNPIEAKNNLVKDVFSKEFRLEKRPLYYFSIYKISELEYGVIFKLHHIISDGWSVFLINNQVISAYESLAKGREVSTEENFSYLDFIEAEKKYLESERFEKNKKFWMERYQDLPEEFLYNTSKNLEGKRLRYDLSKELSFRIKEFINEQKCSLNTLFISVMLIYLCRTTGEKDIVIGTPVFNRSGKAQKGMIGMFTSTVPFRFYVGDRYTVDELFKKVNKELKLCFFNQRYPYDLLIDDLGIMEKGYNSLFKIFINYYNTQHTKRMNGMDIKNDEYYSGKQSVSLQLSIREWEEDTINIDINYKTSEYEKEEVESMYSSMMYIIEQLMQISSNGELVVDDIDLLPDQQKNKIMNEFNNTCGKYPKEKTVQQLFEEQVQMTPDMTALVFQNKRLTYRELNEKANAIARVLRGKGVQNNSIVGLMVERSLEMIVGILGILKAGGAYLPIDPDYPKDRIDYMIKDSKAKVILVEENFINKAKWIDNALNIQDKSLYGMSTANLGKNSSEEDTAYVIYTSGTTGNPKGIMFKNKSLVNLINSQEKKTDIGFKKVLQFANICFDVATQEIFSTLLKGGELHLINKEMRNNVDELLEYIESKEIETVFLPTAYFKFIATQEEHISKLTEIAEHIIVAGEQLSITETVKSHIKNNNVYLHNHYGPSETHVVTTYTIDPKSKICSLPPIGKPIANTRVYILDSKNKMLPIGVAGEICISGDCLSKGYINNEKLTQEKFVENPYEKGELMYKTGDLAKWLPNGNIEFLGRKDHQIKIRGFRIELGEIENALKEEPSIKDVVVIAKENNNSEKYICAYIVCGMEVDKVRLKSYLKQRLPEYMIPSYFTEIDEIPMTTNGKVDKKSLPEINLEERLCEYVAPSNKIESKLVKIWEEILGEQQIGIEDNFFDLGGHSLKATNLISKIHKVFNKEITLKDLFDNATIRELSTFIQHSRDIDHVDIINVEEKKYYNTSSAQKRMYILQQFDKSSIAYNMPIMFKVEGDLNRAVIEDIFQNLVKRHESLRTTFETCGDQIMQSIKVTQNLKVDKKNKTGDLEDIMSNFVRPFDLNKGPLIRVEVIENNNQQYLLIDMHHIISDGVSAGILIKEFITLYEGKELQPLKFQYKDFAEWQSKLLNTEIMKKQEKFWLNVFKDEVPTLNMDSDYNRPLIQSFEGKTASFVLNKGITSRLRKLVKETETTLQMVLLASFYILISRYSASEDIVVGVPVAGRQHLNCQDIIGMFVNTLPMRNKPQGKKKFIEFLEEVKDNSLEAYANQSYPLEELVTKLNLERDKSRNPIFDIMFNMVNKEVSFDMAFDELIIKECNRGAKVSKVDLVLNATEREEEIYFDLEYCSKIFSEDTIRRMAGHYENILTEVTSNRETRLDEIDVLDEKDRKKLIKQFNHTEENYINGLNLKELFEQQVEKTPDSTVISFKEKEITYLELNKKSNQLARLLKNKGVKAETIVAIIAERSLEMIIGILAVVKAGGAFLPIGIEYPKERINYMLDDSDANIVLSKVNAPDIFQFNGCNIDLNDPAIFTGNAENLDEINLANDLAYIIYTSGTTGKPKGVMIENKSLSEAIQWRKNEYSFASEHVALPLVNYAFDGFITSLLTPIISGSKVILADDNEMKDPFVIAKYIEEQMVTHYISVPIIYASVLDVAKAKNLNSLRCVTLAGEAMDIQIIEKTKELSKNIEIVNEYGPTENTVITTIMRNVQNEDSILIGKPKSNTNVFIIGKNNKLQPIGVKGELCISGVGLARGYLNKEGLSSKKFTHNPFLIGEKMYRTGDIARWLPSGEIELFGRKDEQVKIRGYRIEVGEIQNRILDHPNVKETILTIHEDTVAGKFLCAYVVQVSSAQETNLEEYLKIFLPDYMIPKSYIYMDKLPLTPNGKVDKRALPKPQMAIRTSEYVAPRNQVEIELTRLWEEILGIEHTGIDDDFFRLGGHSLQATLLINRVYKDLKKEVSLKEFFKRPTIRGLAAYMKSSKDSMYLNIEKLKKADFYQTSSSQERMYAIQEFNKDSVTYNMLGAFKVKGEINKEKLQNALDKVVEKHEILKTYFAVEQGKVIQIVDNNLIPVVIEREENGNEEETILKFMKPFNLNKGPLIRVELLENNGNKYILIDMHHIIGDAVSMNIFMIDFAKAYKGIKLEEVKTQYKDFANWQQKRFVSESLLTQKEYWLNEFKDEMPLLDFPTDYPRRAKEEKGDTITFEISHALNRQLGDMAKKTENTIFTILLSAFYVMLFDYTKQEKLIVGTTVSGRVHPDLHQTMGLFMNTLAIKGVLNYEKNFSEFLMEVREKCIQSYENEEYPFGDLVSELKMGRSRNRNPLFDVMFELIVDERENLDFEGASLEYFPVKSGTSKFDFMMFAAQGKEKVTFGLEYNTSIFKRYRMEEVISNYKNILQNILENSDRNIKEICALNVIKQKEKKVVKNLFDGI